MPIKKHLAFLDPSDSIAFGWISLNISQYHFLLVKNVSIYRPLQYWSKFFPNVLFEVMWKITLWIMSLCSLRVTWASHFSCCRCWQSSSDDFMRFVGFFLFVNFQPRFRMLKEAWYLSRPSEFTCTTPFVPSLMKNLYTPIYVAFFAYDSVAPSLNV